MNSVQLYTRFINHRAVRTGVSNSAPKNSELSLFICSFSRDIGVELFLVVTFVFNVKCYGRNSSFCEDFSEEREYSAV